MRRLGNLHPKKEKRVAENQEPLITLMKGKSHNVTLNDAAAKLIGATVGDRVDVLEGDVAGEYFISKTVDAVVDEANEELPKEQKQTLAGRKLSASLSFTSTYIHPLLKNISDAFQVSKATVEFEGLKWYKLIPTVVEKEAGKSTQNVEDRNEQAVVQTAENENF